MILKLKTFKSIKFEVFPSPHLEISNLEKKFLFKKYQSQNTKTKNISKTY